MITLDTRRAPSDSCLRRSPPKPSSMSLTPLRTVMRLRHLGKNKQLHRHHWRTQSSGQKVMPDSKLVHRWPDYYSLALLGLCSEQAISILTPVLSGTPYKNMKTDGSLPSSEASDGTRRVLRGHRGLASGTRCSSQGHEDSPRLRGAIWTGMSCWQPAFRTSRFQIWTAR